MIGYGNHLDGRLSMYAIEVLETEKLEIGNMYGRAEEERRWLKGQFFKLQQGMLSSRNRFQLETDSAFKNTLSRVQSKVLTLSEKISGNNSEALAKALKKKRLTASIKAHC